MDFEVSIKQFATRVNDLKAKIFNEEATKTSLILPFFSIMGYDIFNPSEFIPEYTADFGTKKGEKVDYAICINDEPIILIEAKSCNETVLDKHGSQLFRYFSTTSAKFGILTNGIKYLFFTDLDETNKLDSSPFFIFDFENIKDSKIKELSKFKKENFDITKIMTTAEELQYLTLIPNVLKYSFDVPTETFIDYILGEIYPGRKTQTVRDKFSPLINKAIKQFKSELLNDILSDAIGENNKNNSTETVPVNTETENIVDNSDTAPIDTTLEEIESFGMVKTLLNGIVEYSRITYKDTLSYFGILLDDNIRKWICRVQIKDNVKYLILPTEVKGQTQKHLINSISDIINYKDEIIKACQLYN